MLDMEESTKDWTKPQDKTTPTFQEASINHKSNESEETGELAEVLISICFSTGSTWIVIVPETQDNDRMRQIIMSNDIKLTKSTKYEEKKKN